MLVRRPQWRLRFQISGGGGGVSERQTRKEKVDLVLDRLTPRGNFALTVEMNYYTLTVVPRPVVRAL